VRQFRVGNSACRGGFQAQMCRVRTPDYDSEKIGGKEYEGIEEEGNYLSGCLFTFYIKEMESIVFGGKLCY